MASSIDNTSDEFRSVPGTGKTHMEEAMSHAASSIGPWVASEAHPRLQDIIPDPPVPNVSDPTQSKA